MTPGAPWEIVWQCDVILPPLLEIGGTTDPALAPLSELMLRCLRLLLPDQRLPDHCGVDGRDLVEWIGVLPCWSMEKQRQLAALESAHFAMASDSVFSGEMVYYSREVLARQRGQLSADEIKSIVRGGVQESMRDLLLIMK